MSTSSSGAVPLWPPHILPEKEYQTLWERVRPEFIASMARQHVPETLAESLARVYLPLAAWVHARRAGRPFVLGVNGAQGSGKSTLCQFLSLILERGYGLRVAGFSIDDIYKTKGERERLGQEVHPLLATRGVPGTHDVALGLSTIDRLTSASGGTAVALPAFNKAVDDRRAEQEWPQVQAPVDVVIFEGWCVACLPQSAEELANPVNALEAEEDADARWRAYVNAQLEGPYSELFGRLDHLIMLRVPSMEAVFEWRSLQERKLASQVQQNGEPRRHLMGEAELRRFIMHYERLTRHALAEMPERADVTLDLDDSHRFVHVRIKD